MVHTLAWVVLAAATLAIPILALAGPLRAAAWLSLLVWVEVGLLLANRLRCPLNSLAARYTQDRSANFDIFLPAWLAGRTLPIFGPLFTLGEALLLWRRLAG